MLPTTRMSTSHLASWRWLGDRNKTREGKEAGEKGKQGHTEFTKGKINKINRERKETMSVESMNMKCSLKRLHL